MAAMHLAFVQWRCVGLFVILLAPGVQSLSRMHWYESENPPACAACNNFVCTVTIDACLFINNVRLVARRYGETGQKRAYFEAHWCAFAVSRPSGNCIGHNARAVPVITRCSGVLLCQAALTYKAYAVPFGEAGEEHEAVREQLALHARQRGNGVTCFVFFIFVSLCTTRRPVLRQETSFEKILAEVLRSRTRRYQGMDAYGAGLACARHTLVMHTNVCMLFCRYIFSTSSDALADVNIDEHDRAFMHPVVGALECMPLGLQQ